MSAERRACIPDDSHKLLWFRQVRSPGQEYDEITISYRWTCVGNERPLKWIKFVTESDHHSTGQASRNFTSIMSQLSTSRLELKIG